MVFNRPGLATRAGQYPFRLHGHTIGGQDMPQVVTAVPHELRLGSGEM